MRWRRKRGEAQALQPGTALEVAPRVERALVALAVHAEQLDGRLAGLEQRIETIAGEIEETNQRLPSHGDLLDVRLHSAKIAAEVARVRVALRGEIDELRAEAATKWTRETKREDRIRTLAEQVLDLSDAIDTRPGDIADEREAS